MKSKIGINCEQKKKGKQVKKKGKIYHGLVLTKPLTSEF